MKSTWKQIKNLESNLINDIRSLLNNKNIMPIDKEYELINKMNKIKMIQKENHEIITDLMIFNDAFKLHALSEVVKNIENHFEIVDMDDFYVANRNCMEKLTMLNEDQLMSLMQMVRKNRKSLIEPEVELESKISEYVEKDKEIEEFEAKQVLFEGKERERRRSRGNRRRR